MMYTAALQNLGKAPAYVKERLNSAVAKTFSLDTFCENMATATMPVQGSDLIFMALAGAFVRSFVVTYSVLDESLYMYLVMFLDIYTAVIFVMGLLLYFSRRYLSMRTK